MSRKFIVEISCTFPVVAHVTCPGYFQLYRIVDMDATFPDEVNAICPGNFQIIIASIHCVRV